MSQQGGPPPGYNPFAVGAQPSGQPDPQSRLGGYLPDANVGQNTSLQNIGLKGNVPISIVGQKERGLIGTFEKQFGVRTKVQLVGFEAVKPAEMATQGHGVEGGGANTPPADATEGVGLEDSKYEQFRQGVMGSKHSHKALHNKMPMPTEFISPLNINPNQTKKIFGENSDSGGGGGNATYEQIFGAGVKIYQNGAVHMGFTPESMLGGLNPPATPGMSRSREQGRGGFLG